MCFTVQPYLYWAGFCSFHSLIEDFSSCAIGTVDLLSCVVCIDFNVENICIGQTDRHAYRQTDRQTDRQTVMMSNSLKFQTLLLL